MNKIGKSRSALIQAFLSHYNPEVIIGVKNPVSDWHGKTATGSVANKIRVKVIPMTFVLDHQASENRQANVEVNRISVSETAIFTEESVERI